MLEGNLLPMVCWKAEPISKKVKMLRKIMQHSSTSSEETWTTRAMMPTQTDLITKEQLVLATRASIAPDLTQCFTEKNLNLKEADANKTSEKNLSVMDMICNNKPDSINNDKNRSICNSDKK